MRRRILIAIVTVAALAVAGFGIPLALAVARIYHDEAIVDLEREAARAVAEVPASSQTSGDPVDFPTDGSAALSLYDKDGRRLLGNGPVVADAPVRIALAGEGEVNDASTDNALVVAAPVTSEEKVFAVVRAELPKSEVQARVLRAWAAMAGLGALVVVVAALVARWQAGRLSRPVDDLVATSQRLGEGDFSVRAPPSGLPELDAAGEALNETAARLGNLISRERSFSADASHQLRTPLTGLRLTLENALGQPPEVAAAILPDAIDEVDRLEATIDDLLQLARDVDRPRVPLDVSALVATTERDWHGRLAAQDRPLRVSAESPLPEVRASGAAVRQILDVLVGNALIHGRGVVSIEVRVAGGGIVIDVADEGSGVSGDPARLFERRSGTATGSGIGLALAASLADAEGGRLVLRERGPAPVFSLLLS